MSAVNVSSGDAAIASQQNDINLRIRAVASSHNVNTSDFSNPGVTQYAKMLASKYNANVTNAEKVASRSSYIYEVMNVNTTFLNKGVAAGNKINATDHNWLAGTALTTGSGKVTVTSGVVTYMEGVCYWAGYTSNNTGYNGANCPEG